LCLTLRSTAPRGGLRDACKSDSRQCRYAGILNQEVQGGYSQFNFGFIGLATRTPIEQNPVTYAHKWFKELWHSRTRQECLVYAN
jgi:hypothetical protein